ncbi:MAG: RNase adapter RapZ [Clostridiaceae bacterium]|uniref:RNase adapter RapZ n=1 Tax=Clostridium porci TaxID=2605778 RepID=A0A7X2NMH8_9CLOT|nr:MULTISPECIES: RNase adapter RapZ [Clostridium]MCI6138561.1 RNase adapter RapZ [Clostridium sp.]MDY3232143.1 RNase adapter RapZ [Clostridiaceae bacterium]MSS37620.1 RNase adapter RapZ [Clostridium porci]
MKLVIVTGMSGAGKTVALKMLEDLGFYCVDNLPITLVDKFVQLVCGGSEIKQAAIGMDIRSGEDLSCLDAILSRWRKQELEFYVLFLDASDAILIKRFKETRRSHPLAAAGRLDKGIEKERAKLEFLKRDADYIIDTSQLLTRELKVELEKIFLEDQDYNNMFVTILSFGFKYGIPEDADLVFDVRFLPNPYYVEELRLLTGEDEAVRRFVMKGGTAAQFLSRLYDMIDFLLPNYIKEGKNQLVVAIGCTGGKHRSVTVAKALCSHLQGSEKYGLKIEHRDVDKDNKRK